MDSSLDACPYLLESVWSCWSLRKSCLLSVPELSWLSPGGVCCDVGAVLVFLPSCCCGAWDMLLGLWCMTLEHPSNVRLCSFLALSWVVFLLNWEQCETSKLFSLFSSIDWSTFKKDTLCSSQILLLCVPTCVAGPQLWLVICAVWVCSLWFRGILQTELDPPCRIIPSGLLVIPLLP